jgi:hypothetical protein
MVFFSYTFIDSMQASKQAMTSKRKEVTETEPRWLQEAGDVLDKTRRSWAAEEAAQKSAAALCSIAASLSALEQKAAARAAARAAREAAELAAIRSMFAADERVQRREREERRAAKVRRAVIVTELAECLARMRELTGCTFSYDEVESRDRLAELDILLREFHRISDRPDAPDTRDGRGQRSRLTYDTERLAHSRFELRLCYRYPF